MSDRNERLIFAGYAWDKYDDGLVRIETYRTDRDDPEDAARWPVDIWVNDEIEDGEAGEKREWFLDQYGPFYASVADFKKDIEVPDTEVWPDANK